MDNRVTYFGVFLLGQPKIQATLRANIGTRRLLVAIMYDDQPVVEMVNYEFDEAVAAFPDLDMEHDETQCTLLYAVRVKPSGEQIAQLGRLPNEHIKTMKGAI